MTPGGAMPLCSLVVSNPLCVWLQLDAIKMLHPDEAVWTALQFAPPANASGPLLAQQQLRAAAMDLLLAEQRARNAIKGFWDDTLRAMEQVLVQCPGHAGHRPEPLRQLSSAAWCSWIGCAQELGK